MKHAASAFWTSCRTGQVCGSQSCWRGCGATGSISGDTGTGGDGTGETGGASGGHARFGRVSGKRAGSRPPAVRTERRRAEPSEPGDAAVAAAGRAAQRALPRPAATRARGELAAAERAPGVQRRPAARRVRRGLPVRRRRVTSTRRRTPRASLPTARFGRSSRPTAGTCTRSGARRTRRTKDIPVLAPGVASSTYRSRARSVPARPARSRSCTTRRRITTTWSSRRWRTGCRTAETKTTPPSG